MGDDSCQSLFDRFFGSKEWDEMFDNSRVSNQVHTFSNRFPLLLEAGSFTQGSVPFRFYNSWLSISNYIAIVENSPSRDASI